MARSRALNFGWPWCSLAEAIAIGIIRRDPRPRNNANQAKIDVIIVPDRSDRRDLNHPQDQSQVIPGT